ncbi:unnamed protein product [Protopolystoma xenopodis]|uniref:Secreted protein n=1 Tax=Protopolystoma xenopodis TaxID=117903 RepID=A0A448WFY6_9PLAT|nr:unnamed protein product [Protopolystoma xenopodis]
MYSFLMLVCVIYCLRFRAPSDLLSRFRLWIVSNRIIKLCGGTRGSTPSSNDCSSLLAALTGKIMSEPRSASASMPSAVLASRCVASPAGFGSNPS